MGLVAGERGLRLVELRLKGARIDLGQQIAFLDELSLLEGDIDEQPVTWLRTVAVLSAVTVPIPVSTIGKSCCWTVVAMTGTGGGGGVATGARSATYRKYTVAPPPKRATVTTTSNNFAHG